MRSRLLPIALTLAAVLSMPARVGAEEATPAADAIELRLESPAGRQRARLMPDESGALVFELELPGGERRRLTPDELATHLASESSEGRFLERLLNISSPLGFAWVALGFLGQLCFTGRMLVQWLASEKQRRSVVPPAFWWMSLVGATMLLAYFAWRRDLVGVIGQSTGWFIYARNLVLIRRAE